MYSHIHIYTHTHTRVKKGTFKKKNDKKDGTNLNCCEQKHGENLMCTLLTTSHGRARQDDQLEPTYNSSIPILDVALKTYRKRWTIEKGGEGHEDPC